MEKTLMSMDILRTNQYCENDYKYIWGFLSLCVKCFLKVWVCSCQWWQDRKCSYIKWSNHFPLFLQLIRWLGARFCETSWVLPFQTSLQSMISEMSVTVWLFIFGKDNVDISDMGLHDYHCKSYFHKWVFHFCLVCFTLDYAIQMHLFWLPDFLFNASIVFYCWYCPEVWLLSIYA